MYCWWRCNNKFRGMTYGTCQEPASTIWKKWDDHKIRPFIEVNQSIIEKKWWSGKREDYTWKMIMLEIITMAHPPPVRSFHSITVCTFVVDTTCTPFPSNEILMSAYIRSTVKDLFIGALLVTLSSNIRHPDVAVLLTCGLRWRKVN